MIELRIPSGDQCELEDAVINELHIRYSIDPSYPSKHPWGEWKVVQGDNLHIVQWSYVGEDNYTDEGAFIGLEFPDGIDCEISCSWIEAENYAES